MERLNPLQQLDAVLGFLATYPYPHIFQHILLEKLQEKGVDLVVGVPLADNDEIQLQNIITKLAEDGLITINPVNVPAEVRPHVVLYIRFKGYVHHAQGGYQGPVDRANAGNIRAERLEDVQMVHQRNTVVLTLVLATGSIGLLLIEILRYLRVEAAGNLLLVVYLAVFCGILCIVLYLLIKEIRRKDTKKTN